MALSLGVKQGSEIILTANTGDGPRRATLRVRRIIDAHNLVVGVDTGPDIALSALERVEVFPKCYAYSGAHDGRGDADYTYIAFEAPREVRIDRVRRGPARGQVR
jgi:hypothetical protein